MSSPFPGSWSVLLLAAHNLPRPSVESPGEPRAEPPPPRPTRLDPRWAAAVLRARKQHRSLR